MTPQTPLSLAGKTILVTGATSGIGLEAAVVFARAGARTLVTGRDPLRLRAAVEHVRDRAGTARVEGLYADFARQSDVRRLAAEVLARCPRLDVLVNNAGSVNTHRVLTTDGVETTFAVNHLAPFLLTHLLLPRLIASAPARIVNVASVGHYTGTLDFDDLNFDHGYGIFRAYARSKLANVLFTRELARRLAGAGVTTNALHPGSVATGIWGHGAPDAAWARALFNAAFAPLKRFFMVSPERGAKTIVYAAANPELEGRSGLYLTKNRPKEPSALARDGALAARLWETSARLTGLAGA